MPKSKKRQKYNVHICYARRPYKGPTLCENRYPEPLTMLIWSTMRPKQVSKNIKNIARYIQKEKNWHHGCIFHYYGCICSHLSPEILTLHVWWGPQRNQRKQISSKSVKEFSSYRGPKIGVSHWLCLSPLQQVQHYRADCEEKSSQILQNCTTHWKWHYSTGQISISSASVNTRWL